MANLKSLKSYLSTANEAKVIVIVNTKLPRVAGLHEANHTAALANTNA
jgi:hypothetical protein